MLAYVRWKASSGAGYRGLLGNSTRCIIGSVNSLIEKRRIEVRSGWLDSIKLRLKRVLGKNVILCDSCMWNWRSTCHNPDRPNATSCPDYRKRGT